jgi:pyrophosphatase PpaX
MYNCLLFDLDGTLLDSRDAVIDGVMYAVERYVPGRFTREELLGRFGESFDSFLASVEEYAGPVFDREQFLQTYLNYVREHHRDVRLFPFVKEGLQRLYEAGYRMGIVTNKQREFTQRDLQTAGVRKLFHCVVTVDDVRKGKPSAEPIEKAMAELNARPQDVLMIGDSQYDLMAAAEAGVKCALLQWYGREQWSGMAPDYRYADFRAFVEDRLAVKAQGGE